MKCTITAVATIALSLSLVGAARGQAKTVYNYAGNSEISALNTARATMNEGFSPYTLEELSSQGRFLGYSGYYYTARAESTAFFGSWSLRVGTNAIRSGYTSPLSHGRNDGIKRLVPGTEKSRTYVIWLFPVIVSGKVTADVSIRTTIDFRSTRVRLVGTLTGKATASVNVDLPGPWPPFDVVSGTLARFGEQKFVRDTADSALNYSLSDMFVYLRSCITSSGERVACRTIVPFSYRSVPLSRFL